MITRNKNRRGEHCGHSHGRILILAARLALAAVRDDRDAYDKARYDVHAEGICDGCMVVGATRSMTTQTAQ